MIKYGVVVKWFVGFKQRGAVTSRDTPGIAANKNVSPSPYDLGLIVVY